MFFFLFQFNVFLSFHHSAELYSEGIRIAGIIAAFSEHCGFSNVSKFICSDFYVQNSLLFSEL
jgi:hypothetical protein